jgi:hypothetical protein
LTFFLADTFLGSAYEYNKEKKDDTQNEEKKNEKKGLRKKVRDYGRNLL